MDQKITNNKYLEDRIEIYKNSTIKYGFLENNKINEYFHVNKNLLS